MVQTCRVQGWYEVKRAELSGGTDFPNEQTTDVADTFPRNQPITPLRVSLAAELAKRERIRERERQAQNEVVRLSQQGRPKTALT